MAEGTYRYRVEAREPGDYTERAGDWEVLYLGRDHVEAVAEAQKAATKGRQAKIGVEVVRG